MPEGTGKTCPRPVPPCGRGQNETRGRVRHKRRLTPRIDNTEREELNVISRKTRGVFYAERELSRRNLQRDEAGNDPQEAPMSSDREKEATLRRLNGQVTKTSSRRPHLPRELTFWPIPRLIAVHLSANAHRKFSRESFGTQPTGSDDRS